MKRLLAILAAALCTLSAFAQATISSSTTPVLCL